MITPFFSKKLTTASGIIDLEVGFTIQQGEIVALYGKSYQTVNKIWFDKKTK